MLKPKLDLNKARDVAYKAALLGREVLLNHFGHLANVSEKNQAGLVSEADIESEKVITDYLRGAYPDFAILGEESSHLKQEPNINSETRARGLWIIDPLDGTTNYVHQLPIYCVSIGLEVAGEVLVAVCDIPVFKKTYTAVRGGGAFVEDRRLSVSDRATINEALLATGFSSYDKSALRSQLQIFGSLVGEARGVRRAGSCVYDLCLVAEGVFDAYWEKNLSPWDTAAGALLVKEAGGVVTTFDTNSFSPFDKSIIAGNAKIHSYVQKRIAELAPS